jgi:hypothetical protein
MRHHIFDHIYVILCPGRDTRAWYMYSVELGSSLRIGVGHMLGKRLIACVSWAGDTRVPRRQRGVHTVHMQSDRRLCCLAEMRTDFRALNCEAISRTPVDYPHTRLENGCESNEPVRVNNGKYLYGMVNGWLMEAKVQSGPLTRADRRLSFGMPGQPVCTLFTSSA